MIKIVSFPRSGQHLIERFLNFYHKENNLNYSYCDYYNHCMKIPCVNNCIFQKNHDWNLNLEIKKSEKFIVLYRSNIEKQLNSFYRHNTNKSILIKNSDVIDYLNFFNEKKKYYNGFINKWVENSNENILKIDYEKLILEPNLNLELILSHIIENYNKKSISNFLKKEKINNRYKKIKIIKLFK